MDFMRFQPIEVNDFIQHLPIVDRRECPYFDPMSEKRSVHTLHLMKESNPKWTVIDWTTHSKTVQILPHRFFVGTYSFSLSNNAWPAEVNFATFITTILKTAFSIVNHMI